MRKLLLRLFVKDHTQTENADVRERYGVLSGAVGIVLNTALSICKFIIGTVTGSISITADASNNLSDVGSSIVNLVGFKMANKPADEEHPFGHGRIEYISALIVSFLILLMGFELGKSSIAKILAPEPLTFSWPSFIVLLLSILAKFWLGLFNRKLGKDIGSPALTAVFKDSFNDMIATGATMVSLLVSTFSPVNIDGYIGLLVAGFVCFSGIGILKDVIGPLLGEPADAKLVRRLKEAILSYDDVIVGVHDLMVHNYGPNRSFASAHVEVPADADILKTHDVIDQIEHHIVKTFGMQMVLHMDPIETNNAVANALRNKVTEIIKEIDEQFSIHDFRVVSGPTHTNLIFDLVITRACKQSQAELLKQIKDQIRAIDEHYFAIITCEYSFVKED